MLVYIADVNMSLVRKTPILIQLAKKKYLETELRHSNYQ